MAGYAVRQQGGARRGAFRSVTRVRVWPRLILQFPDLCSWEPESGHISATSSDHPDEEIMRPSPTIRMDGWIYYPVGIQGNFFPLRDSSQPLLWRRYVFCWQSPSFLVENLAFPTSEVSLPFDDLLEDIPISSYLVEASTVFGCSIRLASTVYLLRVK